MLEVGCGSGRYVTEFASRGAEVIGIALAPAMIDLARSSASKAGIEDNCRFEVADFRHWQEPHNFEICVGIGLFDYISEPMSLLKRMRSVTSEMGVFSFPVRWTFRSLPRWLRLNSRRCPVYFYGKTQVAELMMAAGWSDITVTRLSRDYLVRAKA